MSPWPLACHLSALVGFAIPFGNIIGPLVVWLWRGEEDPVVKLHGRESLNFQMTVCLLLIGFLLVFFGIPGIFGVWAEAPILITSAAVAFSLAALTLAIINFVLIFRNALRAYRGQEPQYYWYWHFLK